MFSVEPSKGCLDVSVEFFGSVLARFVDLSVIEEGHTFVNILALIHDYQGYSLSAVSTTWEESSLRVLMASHSFLVVLRVGPSFP